MPEYMSQNGKDFFASYPPGRRDISIYMPDSGWNLQPEGRFIEFVDILGGMEGPIKDGFEQFLLQQLLADHYFFPQGQENKTESLFLGKIHIFRDDKGGVIIRGDILKRNNISNITQAIRLIREYRYVIEYESLDLPNDYFELVSVRNRSIFLEGETSMEKALNDKKVGFSLAEKLKIAIINQAPYIGYFRNADNTPEGVFLTDDGLIIQRQVNMMGLLGGDYLTAVRARIDLSQEVIKPNFEIRILNPDEY